MTQNDVVVIPASNEDGLFDLDTSTKVGDIYTHPLYKSIKAKYYSANGNVITQFGVMFNPAEFETERAYSDNIYVLQVPQIQYGEQIKKGSVTLTDNDTSIVYVDDGFGAIRSNLPTYLWLSWDVNTNIMIFSVNGVEKTVTTSYLDVNTGIAVFTLDGVTTTKYLTEVDVNTGRMIMNTPLIFGSSSLDSVIYGNVFYDDGLIVMTDLLLPANSFEDYTLAYRSTQTIHETEVLVTANKSEFNYSQNPSAVDVTLENSYEFETTKITNVKPAGTIRIKEVRDITQKTPFTGSMSTGSGTWNDYALNTNLDPTGSYLSTYITTIGLYDSVGDMVAIAKLPKPIKKLPDYNVSFLVRFDS